MTEAELVAVDPPFATTSPMHASQRPGSRHLPRRACCRPCWTLSLTPSRALLPTPTSSLALLTVLEPRLNPNRELAPALLNRATLPVVAIVGARAYIALSCVCARWGGVRLPAHRFAQRRCSSSSRFRHSRLDQRCPFASDGTALSRRRGRNTMFPNAMPMQLMGDTRRWTMDRAD